MQTLDEIWREYVEKEQEWYRNRLTILHQQTKNSYKSKIKGVHNKLIRRIGPEWYQELSPKQLETVDCLQMCIVNDMKQQIVDNCRENLIELGITPQCGRKSLKLALKNCNKCPIEFLLILYQLINPKRTKYSLNDRLLLSAVVHLTMRDTLKELHVRIPSPPRQPPQRTPVVDKKPKKIDYESPYLKPFNFNPQSRRHDIYVNKHIQYPESPYFDYLGSLRNDRETTVVYSFEQDSNPKEIEIKTELEKAQSFYENLFDPQPVAKLLKPTIYRYEDEILVKTPSFQRRELIEKLQSNSNKYIVGGIIETPTGPKCWINSLMPKNALPPCDYLDEHYQKIKDCNNNIENRQLVENLENNKNKYIIGGIVETRNGPECWINGWIPKQTPICDCVEKHNKRVKEYKNHIKRQQLVENLETNNNKFVIGGIIETPNGPECLFNGLIPKKAPSLCDCLEKYNKRIKEHENNIKRRKLVEKLQKKHNKYMIGGIIETPNGPTCWINGLVPKKAPIYDCRTKHNRSRIKAGNNNTERGQLVESNSNKYIIGGITETPDGPERWIHGLVPNNASIYDCRKKHNGSNKYIIGGIVETPDGPARWIHSLVPKTQPICDCMQFYHDYLNQHSNCMKLYEDYLKQIDDSIDELFQQDEDEIGDCKCQEKSKVIVETLTKLQHEQDEDFPDNYRRKSNGILQTPIKFEDVFDEDENQFLNCRDDCQIRFERSLETSTKLRCEECGIEEDSQSLQNEEKSRTFKRFFIYKKLPCSLKEQQSILKAALDSMAGDGYPLAKLPNSYQLPHFKLWMQMRCGKYWTQSDRRLYLLKNIRLWNHTDSCRRDIPMAKLKISRKKASTLTWKQADYCRKIVREAKDLYYKHLKEAIIDLGREFYPTTYSYEFPSKMFRDCYFAYVPTKEADINGKWVWEVTEVKDFSKRIICH